MRARMLGLVACLCLGACAGTPAPVSGDDVPLTVATQQQEAAAQAIVRALLVNGIDRAAARLTRPGGYVRGGSVAIPFPDALQPMATALRAQGRGELVDDFVTDLGVAAEIVAPKSRALLRAALDATTIRDAAIVVAGGGDAATRQFRVQCESELLAAYMQFTPDALRRSGVTDSYNAMVDAWNALPGSTKLAFDHELYVREHAVAGLFVAIGEEERRLRADPAWPGHRLLRELPAPDQRADQGE